MHISLTGVQIFLDHLSGKLPLAEVLEHEAYRTIFAHSRQFGDGLSEADVRRALEGGESPYYGLRNLMPHLPAISRLMQTIQDEGDQWVQLAETELKRLLPREDLDDILIYPTIGYDAGIGLDGVVCMNLNFPPYLADANEFLYTLIHEVFHVVYARIHVVPNVNRLSTSRHWLSFFALMLQNEGYAVYAPLRLRAERGHLGNRSHPILADYVVLSDPAEMEEHLSAFRQLLQLLNSDPLNRDEYLERIFGPQRLTYRVGCELVRRIELEHGLEAVQEAVYLSGAEFLRTYRHLLS
ncbi:MAG: DUF5700 domain-containing putative Zn-dependent protease [Bacillota bacterium]